MLFHDSAFEVEAIMVLLTRRSNRGLSDKTCTLRRNSGWLSLSILAAGISGCGLGGPTGTSETAAAPEGSALPTQVATDEDGPGARANGNPGIMVTPAGGGGIVVGDPFDGGKGAAAGPAVAPVAATAVAQAAPPTADRPATAPEDRARRKKGREADYEDYSSEDDAASTPAATPAAPVISRFGSEDGDEPPPADARPNLQSTPGAVAQDRGVFRTKREEAEANAARAAADDGRVEDVDSPPLTEQNPNVALGRGFGGRGKGRDADGDESFANGVDSGLPAGEVAIKRGSADEVAETFLALLAAGEVEKIVPLISARATGTLVRLRDGTATPEEIEELRGLAQLRQQENSRPKGGSHRLITFRADKKMLLVEAEQKDEDSSVVKLDVRDAPRRRK